TRLQGDWSSDVCSSDLPSLQRGPDQGGFDDAPAWPAHHAGNQPEHLRPADRLRAQPALSHRRAALSGDNARIAGSRSAPSRQMPRTCTGRPLMEPVMRVEQLVKHFAVAHSKKPVQAVTDVSFAIERGQTLGLVG